MTTAIWNDRYSSEEYIYGTEPNEYFRQQIDRLHPGKILLPAEGEGRNAVYAAKKGWAVEAFDQSSKAQEKALQLAKQQNVSIDYIVAPFEEMSLPPAWFDAIALIYFHIPGEMRKEYHRGLIRHLKPGGIIILEAFAKSQLNKDSGGPKDPGMLYSTEELEKDFKSLQILHLEYHSVILSEGSFHQGEADVVRMLAVKEN